MNVNIKNIGNFKTNYIVTVTECTMNLLKSIPAQARTLDVDEEETLRFDVFTLYNMDTSNECLCTMKSPAGKVYDEVWVRFDTEKYTSKYSWDLQEKNMASTGVGGVFILGDSTCDKVVDFRDFADLARCWLVGFE